MVIVYNKRIIIKYLKDDLIHNIHVINVNNCLKNTQFINHLKTENAKYVISCL